MRGKYGIFIIIVLIAAMASVVLAENLLYDKCLPTSGGVTCDSQVNSHGFCPNPYGNNCGTSSCQQCEDGGSTLIRMCVLQNQIVTFGCNGQTTNTLNCGYPEEIPCGPQTVDGYTQCQCGTLGYGNPGEVCQVTTCNGNGN